MLGILGLVGGVAVGILMAIPAKTLHNTPGLHRFETWQNRVSGFFEKEEVPAAKFDIDKDAQIAHARIAIATSHVVGKGPGNSIQRDFLSQAFSDFIFAILINVLVPPLLTRGRGCPVTGNNPTATIIFSIACDTNNSAIPMTRKAGKVRSHFWAIRPARISNHK